MIVADPAGLGDRSLSFLRGHTEVEARVGRQPLMAPLPEGSRPMPLSDPIVPIVDEIHAIREAIAKASNDDLRKVAEAAKN